MNTEKLEKLKKSLDNKFIPDSMKDKIRTEIQKLESEIKEKEITPTEIKEEVKNIEEKVEEAIEVAEKKEEKQEKTTSENLKKTPKASTGTKKTAMALAKEIRKEGESWTDAVKRAGKEMKGIKEDVKKETKSEIDKLKSLIRKRKDLKGVSNSNLLRDGQRKAMPMGKRTSATGNTYYENRRNRTDKGKVGDLYLAEGGSLNSYNVIYSTKSGRTMVAKNIMATNKEEAEAKLKKEMRASNTFDKVVMVNKSFANGGAIKNQYKGKNANEVWDMWTPDQREHFLADHYDVLDGKDLGAKNKSFKSLNFLTQVQLDTHINQGQYANGGFMEGVYAKGGLLTPSQRYIQEIKGLTGLTQKSIEDYISENKLSNEEVLNIVIGLGRKQIDNEDVATAIIGKKNNVESNKLLIFAKSKKAMSYAVGGGIPNNYEGKTPEQIWNMLTTSQKYHFLHDHNKEIESTPRSIEDNTKKSYKFLPSKVKISFKKHIETGEYSNGGMMNNMSVHDGTDFMNTPVYYRGGAMAFEDGGDFMSGAYAEEGAEIDKRDKQGMIYALQEHVSSGEIANMTDLLNYDSIAESRSKAIQYYVKYGDKPYSMTELKNVLSMVSTPLYHKYKSKFADGGDFMSGAYAEDGAMVNKDGIRVKSVAMPKKELSESEWLAKHNESREARSYGVGGNLPSYLKDKESVMFEKGKNVVIDERNYNESLGMTTLFDVYVNGLKAGKVQYDIEHEDYTAFSSKGFTGNTRFSLKEFENKDQAIKYIVDNTPKSFAVGGGIFADTFTGYTGTHYTGLTGETNAMSSGEMFMAGGRVKRPMYIIHDDNTKDTEPFKNLRTLKEFEDKANELGYIASVDRKMGWIAISKTPTGNDILIAETLNPSKEMFMAGGRVRRTKAQITRDRENKDIDAYNWYIVDLELNKAISGNEYKEDAIDELSDFDGDKRYKVVSKKTLKSLGIENPNERFKSYEDGGDLFQNYDEQPEELAEITNFYMQKFNEDDYDYEDSQNFLKEVEAIGYTFDYGLDNEPYGLRPIGTELNEYSNGGAIANQQLIADAHLRPAEMFGRLGIPAYNRGGALKNERKYVNHSQDYEVSYARKHLSRHGYGNIKYDGGGEFSQFGKFISSQIEYIISLKTIASKKEPIQNLLKNMDDYRGGTEIEKRLTTDNLKYALQQKTVSKINEVLKISLNALKD